MWHLLRSTCPLGTGGHEWRIVSKGSERGPRKGCQTSFPGFPAGWLTNTEYAGQRGYYVRVTPVDRGLEMGLGLWSPSFGHLCASVVICHDSMGVGARSISVTSRGPGQVLAGWAW